MSDIRHVHHHWLERWPQVVQIVTKIDERECVKPKAARLQGKKQSSEIVFLINVNEGASTDNHAASMLTTLLMPEVNQYLSQHQHEV